MHGSIAASVDNVEVKSRRPHPDSSGIQPHIEMGQFLTTPGELVAAKRRTRTSTVTRNSTLRSFFGSVGLIKIFFGLLEVGMVGDMGQASVIQFWTKSCGCQWPERVLVCLHPFGAPDVTRRGKSWAGYVSSEKWDTHTCTNKKLLMAVDLRQTPADEMSKFIN